MITLILSIFSNPFHTQVFLSQVPCLIRTDHLVDFRVIDICLQVTVVTIPAKIFFPLIQLPPCAFHCINGFGEKGRKAALQIGLILRKAGMTVIGI